MNEFLNIDRFLRPENEPKNRIERIGVELEGGWQHLPADVLLEHDGSVTNLKKAGDPPLRTGELPSPPKIPAAMWPWMKKYYPSHINNTCGLHVHMSFESARWYQMLMTKQYQNTVIEYLKRWGKEEGLCEVNSESKKLVRHPLWDRLEGKNKYCKLEFWPDKQAAQKRKSHNMEVEGHRYTAINYCFAKDNCQTVECRVLPMFDTYEQSVRAVKRVLLITNACLVTLASKEPPFYETINLQKDSGPYVDVSIETIR